MAATNRVLLSLTSWLLVTSLAGVCCQESHGWQKRRQRFGNGALLRRIFGNDKDDEEKQKKQDKKNSSSLLKNNEDQFRKKIERAKRELDQKIKRLQRKVADKFSVDPRELENDRRQPELARPTELDENGRGLPLDHGRTADRSFSSLSAKGSPAKAKSVLGSSIPDHDIQRYKKLSSRSSSVPTKRSAGIANVKPSYGTGPGEDSNQTVIPKLYVNPNGLVSNQEEVSRKSKGSFGTSRGGYSQSLQSSKLFGINVQVDFAKSALKILAVSPRSHAKKYGLRQGDLIVEVAGAKPTHIEDVDSLLRILGPDEQFELDLIRNGKRVTKLINGPEEGSKKSTAPSLNWPPKVSVSSQRQFDKQSATGNGLRPTGVHQQTSDIQKLRSELAAKEARIRLLESQLKNSQKASGGSSFKPLLKSRKEASEMELELDSPNG